MTVKDYGKKVESLIDGLDNKVHGLELTSEIGISVINTNGKPTLVFCKTDERGNPIEIIQCMPLDSPQIIRRLQVWLEYSLNMYQLKSVQDSDANVLVSGEVIPESEEIEK